MPSKRSRLPRSVTRNPLASAMPRRRERTLSDGTGCRMRSVIFRDGRSPYVTLTPAASASAVITLRISASWKSTRIPSGVARAPAAGAAGTGRCAEAAGAIALVAASAKRQKVRSVREGVGVTSGPRRSEGELDPGSVRRAEGRAALIECNERELTKGFADAHRARRIARDLADGEAAAAAHHGAEQAHGGWCRSRRRDSRYRSRHERLRPQTSAGAERIARQCTRARVRGDDRIASGPGEHEGSGLARRRDRRQRRHA